MRKYRWHASLLLLCLLYVAIGQTDSVSAFSGGSGEEGDPYLITTAEQLREIDYNLGAHYRLAQDIDLGVAPFNEGEGWEPLGYFSGTLDGGGYAIRNMKITNPTTQQQGQTSPRDKVGLFSELSSSARVYNLSILDADIEAYSSVGAVAGISNLGSVNEVAVSGSIRGNTNVGGVLGANRGGSVTNVVFYGDIQGNFNGNSGNANAGSIVGSNDDYEGEFGYVGNAFAFGTVQAQAQFGGIVGYNNGEIYEVYAMHKQLLYSQDAAGVGDFGRIAGSWTSSASGEGLYASPAIQPPDGYPFGVGGGNDGELLSGETGLGQNGMYMLGEIVKDEALAFDIFGHLFAQVLLIAAEPVFLQGDTYDSVTRNIELPEIDAEESEGQGPFEEIIGGFNFSWSSSDPNTVDSSGIVNRPYGNENVNVQLTSTVTGSVYSGGAIGYLRNYTLTVLHTPPEIMDAYLTQGSDLIHVVFSQIISGVNEQQIKVFIDNSESPFSVIDGSNPYELILQIESEWQEGQSITIVLQTGAVTDTNGSPNEDEGFAREVRIDFGEVEYDLGEVRNHVLEALQISDPNETVSIEHILKYMNQADVYYTGNEVLSRADVKRLLELIYPIYS